MSSTIQLLLGDDQAFAVRSIALVGAIGTFVVWRGRSIVSDPTSTEERSDFCSQIHRPGRSNRTPSSFKEVSLPSVNQLLLGDDRTFAVRSSVLAPSSFREVTMSSAIQLLLGDDRAFAIRFIAQLGAIGTFIVWRGGSAVSD
ncbi:hypothetical protein E5676_scaffold3819G00020 [Cucumis melo var. makuwa]|uniref:Uncharacterized protein n=1 Tax=Cucumis melo var. makuwa TaxID=1194695 RepID=A0A5D3DHE1_CUCMM|nr:hypothetical protein E6C27_scaffold22G00410 [Cucumis melo var. makuwa]TYK23036.1 hypothetical protein E5676_scaffold3819G00020 [Cucumis melo var. makuwa]